jgi:large-conductance mechanosensitive channel
MARLILCVRNQRSEIIVQRLIKGGEFNPYAMRTHTRCPPFVEINVNETREHQKVINFNLFVTTILDIFIMARYWFIRSLATKFIEVISNTNTPAEFCILPDLHPSLIR